MNKKMPQKQIHSYSTGIIYSIGLILALTAILGTIFSSDGINITKTETVLLNPKYAPLVSIIKISREQTNENLTIERTRKSYRGIIGELIFPIDAIKADELIAISKNNRILYKTSDSYDTWSAFSIDDASAIVLSFWGADSPASELISTEPLTEFSRLYFGTEDFSGSQITVRTARSPDVYRTQNDFYTFLTFSPSVWADGKLIPDYLKNGKTENDITSLSLIQNDAENNLETKLIIGDNIFDDAVYTLFSLRSSRIIDIPQFITDGSTAAKISVRAVFQGNHTAEFSVYPQTGSYIVVPKSNDLRYALEISEWTFQNILNAFTLSNR